MKTIEIPCLGYTVQADWYEGSGKGVLLVMHGFGSSKKNQYEFVSSLVKRSEYSALVIDMSGHGGETQYAASQVTPAQNFMEAITALDWIKENHLEENIAVLGTSYGGFQAAQLTKYRSFEKLILRVPALYRARDFYTKIDKVERHVDRGVADFQNLVTDHPLLSRAKTFNGSTLVVVHEHDEAVPSIVTDSYIKAFDADVYVAKGFWHSLAHPNTPRDKIEEYQARIAKWLRA